ncbi:hypothetical protein CFC21_112409, partial [Triticum aestivum]|nr:hypothetical protein [Triticum aestivum]
MGLMAGMLPGIEFARRRRLRPAAEAACAGARRPASLGVFWHDHAHLGSAGFAMVITTSRSAPQHGKPPARCSERCSRRNAAAGGSAGAGGRSSSSRRSARCAWRSSGAGTCWRTSPARTASTGPAPCPGSRPPPAAPSAAPPSTSPTTSLF